MNRRRRGLVWGAVIAVLALVVVGVAAAAIGMANREDESLAKKPVIYLYPEQTTAVRVDLDTTADLTFAYPALDPDSGWTVTAEPDGTLTTGGRSYPSLFWEARTRWAPDLSTGSVVAADQVVPFLERTLAELGLNDRESAEFITYWAPMLTAEPYTLVHFSVGAEVNALARLDVSPTPDTEIRVFMTYRAVADPAAVRVEPQRFSTPERTGFVLVEWGGQSLD